MAHFTARNGKIAGQSAVFTPDQAAGIRDTLSRWHVKASPENRPTYDTLISELDAALEAVSHKEIAA